MYIKKGDNIEVVSGKDRGKRGKVIRVLLEMDKVVIEGINLSKRRQKPKKEGQKGQVVQVPMPIHSSNVMIVCPKGNKRTRIGKKKIGEKNIRISKKSGAEL